MADEEIKEPVAEPAPPPAKKPSAPKKQKMDHGDEIILETPSGDWRLTLAQNGRLVTELILKNVPREE